MPQRGPCPRVPSVSEDPALEDKTFVCRVCGFSFLLKDWGIIDDGADLAAVITAKPTRGFDEHYGDPAMMIDRAYASLTTP